MTMLNFGDEFFAVEQMTARMVNDINGVVIDGLSLNVYIYVIIFFLVISWLLFEFYKKIPFDFMDLGRKTLILMFVFWSLMEIKSTLNYISYAQDDFRLFSYKTLDQKRMETPTEGLYKFAKLVEEKTPKEAKIKFFILNNDDFIKIKLKYYLAPTHFNQVESLEAAEYIAGYGVNFMPKNILGATPYGWVAKR